MRIIVSGFIAQHPRLAGVTWDYLQYVIGLRDLGHDVFYFEDSGEWHYRLPGEARDDSAMPNVRHLAYIMERFGMHNRWAYRSALEARWYGMEESRRNAILESADVLINVSGALQAPEQYRNIPRLAYIDSDPGFTQVRWAIDSGLRERIAIHDVWFSFGSSLDSPMLPKTPYRWIPTHSPIVLEEWSPGPSTRNVCTTVMSWTSYRPLQYEGRQFGQKDLEFKRFIDLPSRVPNTRLEVAMHLHRHEDWEQKGSPDPPAVLRQNGWLVTDSETVAGDIDAYREYIRCSMVEWSVAKQGYVAAKTGWFSCRSACYLAAGRPVVVQDTGFANVIRTDRGILSFQSLTEAEECVREVDARLQRHSEAARDLAREHFDSRKVLSRLIEQATASDATRLGRSIVDA